MDWNISPSRLVYDLSEVDWACISDYLNTSHLPILFYFSSSSHGSLWCLNAHVMKIPWVFLLHQLESDIQQIIIDMVHTGT